MLYAISLLFLALGIVAKGGLLATILLTISQLIILGKFIAEKHVTSVGAFLFMSFLFFGIRPLYIQIEDDKELFEVLFRVDSTNPALHVALCWAVAGTWLLAAGCALQRWHGHWNLAKLLQRSAVLMQRTNNVLLSNAGYGMALFIQTGTMMVMAVISTVGRDIYTSNAGAYAWDFPMVLQGIQVLGLAVAVERWRVQRTDGSLIALGYSFLVLAITSFFAREVTLFRGAYVTTLLVGGFAILFRFRGRVGYIWLILPIVVLLPVFRTLGESRNLGNQEAGLHLRSQFRGLEVLSYWHFFDSSGDMNIYDTFVAAIQHEPTKKPYALSWLYVPVHVVPRAFWSDKPERGILQDLSYTNGAPYSPGLMGFFVGDGGKLWMLANMLVLGYLLSWMDMKVLLMRPGYFKVCVYAILAVNALYFTRFYLWQYAWQVFYFLFPCWFFAKYVMQRFGMKANFHAPPRPPGRGQLGVANRLRSYPENRADS